MSVNPNQLVGDTYRYQDDEISLFDIWQILAKRKKLILGITAAAFIAGTLVALIKSPKYAYRASIEIGSRPVANGTIPIEQPENVLAKLQQSYIPAVILEHYRASGIDDVKIEANIPKKSEIIIISSKSTEKRAEELITLQNQVIERLQNDHQRIISTLKADLEIKRRGMENKLESLKDEARILDADKLRYKEHRELLKAEIADLKRLIESTESQYKRAVAKPGNEANAMTLLLLDSEARDTRTKLSELQAQLQIDLARDEDKLANDVADNQRKQSEEMDRIAKALLEYSNFRDTRAVLPPMQSIQPVGLSKKAIVLLSLIVGLFVSIFTAFIAEFIAKAKEQLALTNQAHESAQEKEPETFKSRAVG